MQGLAGELGGVHQGPLDAGTVRRNDLSRNDEPPLGRFGRIAAGNDVELPSISRNVFRNVRSAAATRLSTRYHERRRWFSATKRIAAASAAAKWIAPTTEL